MVHKPPGAAQTPKIDDFRQVFMIILIRSWGYCSRVQAIPGTRGELGLAIPRTRVSWASPGPGPKLYPGHGRSGPRGPGWVPEGSLAENARVGFRPIFGQTWLQNPSRTTGLILQCWLHQKSTRQTNSKAILWPRKNSGRTAFRYPEVGLVCPGHVSILASGSMKGGRPRAFQSGLPASPPQAEKPDPNPIKL